MPEHPFNLAFTFGLKPAEAIRYFEKKLNRLTWDWHESDEADHAMAFTVAKVTSMDVLTTIRDELTRSLKEGVPFQEFKKNLTPKLQALGWWGRQISIDADGVAIKEQLGSPRRLETIYRCNMQSALMAGRYKALRDNAAARPYWQYVAVHDSRTRPSHMALDGAVFKWDDPIWENIFPPNDFNCRCTVRALTERQVENRGLTVIDSSKYTTHWVSTDRLGNEFERTSIKLPGMREFSTGAGWNGNPALMRGDNLTMWALNKAAKAEPVVAAAAIGAILKNPIAFYQMENSVQEWIKALDIQRTTKAKIETGVLHLELIHNLAFDHGITSPTALISLIDERFAHAGRQGIHRPTPFTHEEWLALPRTLLDTPLVLLDKTSVKINNDYQLLYLTPSLLSGQAAKKIVVTLNYDWEGRLSPTDEMRTRMLINAITTAYTTRSILSHWNSDNFPVVYGSWADFWRYPRK
ncbi:MAG: phage minor head protein [Betaproteobacteria bacterium]|nr:phage minor head protein [Betaproteobacteria bacterium]